MIDTEEIKKIVIVSDATGKTAKRLMDAVLAHYELEMVWFSVENIYKEVRDRETIDQILSEIEDEYLVVFSIISQDLTTYFRDKLKERAILYLNVLEPMLKTMSKFLGIHPDYRPGLLQIVDDRYYKKVDSIGYTVEHDDGLGQFISEADIILVGLSRTCKTPISMYIACNFGLKVANIPIVDDDTMERNLLNRLAPLKHEVILGLTVQPNVLAEVRRERSQYLARGESGHSGLQEYYDAQKIREEVRYCRHLFNQEGWPMIDVTQRAIEEIALEILEKRGLPTERP